MQDDDIPIGIEKCPCGDEWCNTYHLTGIGNFVQGSGFTLAEAERIVVALHCPVSRLDEKTLRSLILEAMKSVPANVPYTDSAKVDAVTKALRPYLTQAQQPTAGDVVDVVEALENALSALRWAREDLICKHKHHIGGMACTYCLVDENITAITGLLAALTAKKE